MVVIAGHRHGCWAGFANLETTTCAAVTSPSGWFITNASGNCNGPFLKGPGGHPEYHWRWVRREVGLAQDLRVCAQTARASTRRWAQIATAGEPGIERTWRAALCEIELTSGKSRILLRA